MGSVMEEKRIALVTEAGNGLGKMIADILLNHNYKVILAAAGKSYELLTELYMGGEDCKVVEVDFTSDKSLCQLKHLLYSYYGKLDLLINNAEVVNGFGQKINQIELEDVKYLYEVNFFAVLRLIQLTKPLLEKSENPKIINVTSALGDVNKMKDKSFCYSDYSLTAYATSKAALNMYTLLQAKEFKPSKIAIHAFDPVVRKYCTYNSVVIGEDVRNEFIDLIS
jgi:NAD(P)-dependent dehydrogenase (short-subunit alcohol dehydrogenase family)